MPKKGEKLSPEHLAKLQAGRKARKGGSQATAPAKPEDGERLTASAPLRQPKEATTPLIAQGQVPNLTKKKEDQPCGRRALSCSPCSWCPKQWRACFYPRHELHQE